ncbi:DUF892 family protein [Mucilaginibacter aquaedulcis]|uniref:DUF892 family protein n=1 Tax=Mucilaginibacter aquaedulcis TaxID=1187081 RepID=UPI0025B47062|nr:DUF892 family protein [Mucilaginibacter aquaedulcis]MDN3550217.1 DUF892 family protein [Mucilaginibacter aquaedulcis]
MENSTQIRSISFPVIKGEQFDVFFNYHLNRIFCAKSHLHERLPKLARQGNFQNMRHAIMETWVDIGNQIARIEHIFILLNSRPSLNDCNDLINFLESGFSSIFLYRERKSQSEFSILFYMSMIESVELTAFKLLEIAATKLPDESIRQLIKKSFDESKSDRRLFLEIAANISVTISI